MKISFRITMIIILFLILAITTVNASGILMNLEDYTPNTSDENLSAQISSNTTRTETNNENDSPRVISSTTSEDDEFLTVENILSIIIIVIGILLILLAVAILIRFK